jgi:hypothetical protein
LLVQLDGQQGVKGSRDPLEKGHDDACAPYLLDTARPMEKRDTSSWKARPSVSPMATHCLPCQSIS